MSAAEMLAGAAPERTDVRSVGSGRVSWRSPQGDRVPRGAFV